MGATETFLSKVSNLGLELKSRYLLIAAILLEIPEDYIPPATRGRTMNMTEAEQVVFNTPVLSCPTLRIAKPSRAITRSGKLSTEDACTSALPIVMAAS
jgi:hypothetical protein